MKSITLRDVAEKAGVSLSTVSTVLNNRKSWVGEETRRRIQGLAQELGYRPNYHARNLKAGKTNCIGLLGSSSTRLSGHYPILSVFDGIEKELSASENPYHSITFSTRFGNNLEKTIQMIESGFVDGAIWTLLAQDLKDFEQEIFSRIEALDLVVVIVHSLSCKMPFHNVGLDNKAGGALAAERLVQKGHRHIGFYVPYPDRSDPQTDEIFRGFKDALDACAIKIDLLNPLEILGLKKRRGDYRMSCEVANRLPRKEIPTAVFAPLDACAHGFVKGFRERGLRVPEDVAVLGFDDEEAPEYFASDLTTVHHPFLEKGRLAAQMLTKLLDGRLNRDSIHQEIAKPHLVVRGTA